MFASTHGPCSTGMQGEAGDRREGGRIPHSLGLEGGCVAVRKAEESLLLFHNLLARNPSPKGTRPLRTWHGPLHQRRYQL